MYNIPTLYLSYQELLLDIDIFGRLMDSQSLDDKSAYKELLFQEYSKTHPVPSLEGRDYELSDLVSEDFHVSYMNELELSQNESVLSFDDDDDEDEGETETTKGINTSYDDLSLPTDFPKSLFINPMTIEARDSLIGNDDYFNTSEIEEFTGSIQKVEEVYDTIGSQEGYFEEVVDFPEQGVGIETLVEVSTSEEEEDDFNYDDDVYDNDEEDYEEEDYEEEDFDDSVEDLDTPSKVNETPLVVSDSSDDFEMDFVDEVRFIPTKPVLKDVVVPLVPVAIPVEVPKQVDRSSVPPDILQFIRENPRCEVSLVLSYYPRKDLEKYIRTGKVIKKGSKVYI